MAFAFQQESNNNSLTTIIMVVIAIAMAAGIYMLFFAEEPFIEVVAPPEVNNVSELSKVDFSAVDFAQSEVFSSLQRHVSDAEAGPAGRTNPFSPF